MRKPSAKQLENGIADIGGKMLEGGHADEGVAVAVEFGAPDGDGEVAGDVGRYAAAYAALAGEAGAEGEVARLVVEATGEHECSEAFGLADGQDLPAVEWVHATVAQEEEGAGKVRARHRDGALVAVDVQQRLHVILNIPEALHEIGQGQVAVGIEPLGAGYLLVVVDIVVGA